ncbi:MAG: hypothetical protein V7K32_01645 [Nostoc sp.]|uniref:hypothetical protein n=1 Tax=Nostoc sp. TaxID=1180 RepID=UPI002FF614FD
MAILVTTNAIASRKQAQCLKAQASTFVYGACPLLPGFYLIALVQGKNQATILKLPKALIYKSFDF